MKQIKFNFLFKIILINFFISILITYLIINLTPIRYENNLTFKINLNSIPLRYIQREMGLDIYTDPRLYIKTLDRNLRYDLNNNNCSNLGKIKKILPISFSLVDNEVFVNITSIDLNNVNDCSRLIISKIEQYNIKVKEHFIEEYEYSLNINKSKKPDLNDQIIQNIDNIIKKLESSYSQDFNISNDILKILTILNLKQNLLSFENKELPKKRFKVLLEELKIISLKGEKLKLSEPPSFYMISTSTFIILIFSYLVIFNVIGKNISLKRFVKKLTN